MKKTLSVLLAVGLATTALSACSTSGGGGGGGAGGQGGGGGVQASFVTVNDVGDERVGVTVEGDDPENFDSITVSVKDPETSETTTYKFGLADTDTGVRLTDDKSAALALSTAAGMDNGNPAVAAGLILEGTGFSAQGFDQITKVTLALDGTPTETLPNAQATYAGDFEVLAVSGDDTAVVQGDMTATADFGVGNPTLTMGFTGTGQGAGFAANMAGGTINADSTFDGVIDVTAGAVLGVNQFEDVTGVFSGTDAQYIVGGGGQIDGDDGAAIVFAGAQTD